MSIVPSSPYPTYGDTTIPYSQQTRTTQPVPSTMQSDYANYFSTSKPGETTNWAGGTLTRGAGGATYTAPNGQIVPLTPGSDLNSIAAQNPNIANQWASQYGYSAPAGGSGNQMQNFINTLNPGQQTTYDANGNPTAFQPNLYQYSTGGGQSGSTSQGASSSSSSNFAGLDEAARKQLLASIMPSLTKSAEGLEAVPDQYANDAVKSYELEARQSLEKTLPQVMEMLGAKNMMNSSVSEEAQAGALRDIIGNLSKQAYDSKMKAAEMKMDIPGILGQIAELGKYSQGSSTGTSKNDSLSNSMNYNYSADPSQPYTNYAQILNYLGDMLVGV